MTGRQRYWLNRVRFGLNRKYMLPHLGPGGIPRPGMWIDRRMTKAEQEETLRDSEAMARDGILHLCCDKRLAST